MIFNSVEFFIFFIAVYTAYRFLNRRGQNFLLLAASYFFYGSWDWRFLLLLWASTIIDYLCSHKIESAPDSGTKRLWLVLSLSANLIILGFFKYFNFFTGSLVSFLKSAGIVFHPMVLHVILPVGVSFYTFQSISYIVDVYSNKIKAEKNFFDYALFVAFFPQLVAGPIERAGHMLPQYKSPRVISDRHLREGLWFIYWGFFLKIFVADNLAQIVNLVFDQSGRIPGIEVVLGSYAFAFQVFGDFAGYSFIAMGLARLLGIELMVNFRFPYFVTNPAEFWRNWHISLSTWLRDYLYIPLGGNRRGQGKTYRNLMITMLLGGLWHGAAWTYVIWGGYQGLTLVVYRLFRSPSGHNDRPRPKNFWVRLVQIILMFQVTCLGWLIFRSNSIGQLSDFLQSLIFNAGIHSQKTFYLAGKIVFYAAPAISILLIQKYKNDLMAIPNLGPMRSWIFYLLMFYALLFWGEFGGHQFIYFQF